MRLSSKLLATLPFPMSFKTKFSRLTSHVIEIRLHGRGITLFAWVFWTHQSEGFGLSPKKVAATSLSLDQAREIANQVRIYQKQQRAKTDAPESVVEQVVEDARTSPETYRGEVFDLLLKLPSGGFERLSQRLLREAGFIQVVVTGRSGDGGIDGHGTLQINPLVSFKVVFQCKRYAKSVSPSHVRDFRGAMTGRADKGIIITTGTFTAEARREASRDGAPPIDLIDGDKLVDMLENLELGLKPVTSYEIDREFFAEFNS
jgi:restriction system protein